MAIRCQVCKTLYETKADPATWGCPTCPKPEAAPMRFTVDPHGARGFGRRNTTPRSTP